jgi:hypothetical protein
MSRVLFFLLFVLSLLSLPFVAKKFTQGFRVAKLEFHVPHHPEWEVPMDSQILSILDQPYAYLGKGAQSYVFASLDGRYVVKLFRSDSEEKIIALFNACKMAYDCLKEETGLVYLHLNPTSQRLPILTCQDPLGRGIKLPLDRYRFAIQKRAKPFRETLEAAMGDPALMKARIDQFVALLVSRTEKGIFNTDPSLSRNFGFLDDRAVEIDFGNYHETASYSEFTEIKRYTHRLHRWLARTAPEWADYLDRQVEVLE